jgi:dTDP-4-amino-4,6-dideoxygalactose transaminase
MEKHSKHRLFQIEFIAFHLNSNLHGKVQKYKSCATRMGKSREGGQAPSHPSSHYTDTALSWRMCQIALIIDLLKLASEKNVNFQKKKILVVFGIFSKV